jgi:hypothetical protein
LKFIRSYITAGLRFGLLVLLSIVYNTAEAQVPATFVPSPVVSFDSTALKRIDAAYKQAVSSIGEKDKNLSKYIAGLYTERRDYLKSSIEDGEFLFGSFLETYVRNVAQHIISKNPSISKDLLVLVARSPIVNAYSLGDGTIIIYTGLLNRIRNEAQLAFIMCHEIAHDQEKHTAGKIISNAKKYLDPEFKKKLEKVLKEDYMVKQKLTDLVLPSLIEDMRFSREYEIAADSVGLRYFLNTDYDPSAAIEVMDVLDHADEEADMTLIDIKDMFSSDSVPFRKSWTYYEGESSLGTFEEEAKEALDDSLKTHPDTKLRAEILSRMLSNVTSAGTLKYRQPQDKFVHLKLDSEGEIIERYLDVGKVGRTIFLASQMTKHWPHDTIYPEITLAHAFAMLSHYQSRQAAGKLLPLPSTYYHENYDRLISFLWELNVKESAAISTKYLNEVPEADEKMEHVLAAKVYSSFIRKDKVRFESYKSAYMKNFPKGKYFKQFEFLILT